MEAHDLRSEMGALFAKFLPVEIASRFSGLLAMKPDHWSKIDPWKMWDVLDARRVAEWPKTSVDLLASPLFSGCNGPVNFLPSLPSLKKVTEHCA